MEQGRDRMLPNILLDDRIKAWRQDAPVLSGGFMIGLRTFRLGWITVNCDVTDKGFSGRRERFFG